MELQPRAEQRFFIASIKHQARPLGKGWHRGVPGGMMEHWRSLGGMRAGGAPQQLSPPQLELPDFSGPYSAEFTTIPRVVGIFFLHSILI